ncbi:MAG: hypothetical protein M3O26_03120 [Pseudomonadota bacterium]|nr:hypothetical protein [Pseudomonadota bacterium]
MTSSRIREVIEQQEVSVDVSGVRDIDRLNQVIQLTTMYWSRLDARRDRSD